MFKPGRGPPLLVLEDVCLDAAYFRGERDLEPRPLSGADGPAELR